MKLDYAEVADADTLAAVDELVPGMRVIALVAAKLGVTRLLDNMLLTE